MTGWETRSGHFFVVLFAQVVDDPVDNQKGYQRAQKNVCEDENLFCPLIQHLTMASCFSVLSSL